MPTFNINAPPHKAAIMKVETVKLKYKDVLDFGEFFTAMYYYMMQHGWRDEDTGEEFWEPYYGEKVSQSGSKEIWSRWRLFRNADDGQYFKFYLDIDLHCLGLSQVEIVKDGRKIKAMKGEMELTVSGYVYQKFLAEFEKNDILKHFTTLFTKKIYIGNINARGKQMYHEVYEFQHFLKQWLKLKRSSPYGETRQFHPTYAYPSFGKDD